MVCLESEETGGRLFEEYPQPRFFNEPNGNLCNEAQERDVLAISAEDEAIFLRLRKRRCPFAIVGEATDDHKLTLWIHILIIIRSTLK